MHDNRDPGPVAGPLADGGHQWVVMAAYGLTAAEAAALHEGAEQRLDAEHRLSVEGPACMNCEAIWTEAVASQRCPQPWYDARQNDGTRVRQP